MLVTLRDLKRYCAYTREFMVMLDRVRNTNEKCKCPVTAKYCRYISFERDKYKLDKPTPGVNKKQD